VTVEPEIVENRLEVRYIMLPSGTQPVFLLVVDERGQYVEYDFRPKERKEGPKEGEEGSEDEL
jgi:hypothetical protein